MSGITPRLHARAFEILSARIADGTLSPLSGPMDEDTWHQVLDHAVLEYGFRRYAWTAPISLPVTGDEGAPCASAPM